MESRLPCAQRSQDNLCYRQSVQTVCLDFFFFFKGGKVSNFVQIPQGKAQGKPTQLLFLLELLALAVWRSDPCGHCSGRQKRMDGTTSSLWKCREPELMNLGWAPDQPGPGCGDGGSWSRRIWLKSRSNDSPWNAESCNMSICACIWEGPLM